MRLFDGIAGLIRHGLTTGAGVLITNGTITEAQGQTGVGAIMALIGIGWSVWDKWGR